VIIVRKIKQFPYSCCLTATGRRGDPPPCFLFSKIGRKTVKIVLKEGKLDAAE
jgi:hypothetical protein